MLYRDAVLEPEKLRYFAVTDGFAPVFGGVWEGRNEGIYAVSGTRKRFESTEVGEITDGMIPYLRVDGIDPKGETILVVLSTISPEHDMIRTLITDRQILDNGHKSTSHRNMSYRQVVRTCRKNKLVNHDAPMFEKPASDGPQPYTWRWLADKIANVF